MNINGLTPKILHHAVLAHLPVILPALKERFSSYDINWADLNNELEDGKFLKNHTNIDDRYEYDFNNQLEFISLFSRFKDIVLMFDTMNFQSLAKDLDRKESLNMRVLHTADISFNLELEFKKSTTAIVRGSESHKEYNYKVSILKKKKFDKNKKKYTKAINFEEEAKHHFYLNLGPDMKFKRESWMKDENLLLHMLILYIGFRNIDLNNLES